MDSLERARCQKMADDIADVIGLTPMVYKAFCSTPRTSFVPVSINAFKLDAHPIGGNQWISSPLTVAKMTLALEAENCDNILEIGCGSGYQAAILSKIAHRIFSVERIEKLALVAKATIKKLNLNNVNIRYDDGNAGWSSYAPYDRILLSCACDEVPSKLFNQLKDGGILVAPVKNGQKQSITKFIKNGLNIDKIILEECEFVPLLSGRE
ncbi:protein-L-isoaspartate O-methyltransferase [Campylobacter hyointestinalis]|uniref:Protein-L-isoaspartate O-methyltransferase n=1 Tax=Campylobacter hyointestinalis subsp. hyointestinalis TaxID=91352 RepID=A0A0S4R4C4_CAMHY|nr:protein-L-isoaspartate(D-aspartate) O-methyltransferase [Campylobacter hyointestinalis]MBT0612371.1 protein-L-isoaspartate(D-aspartate) O-methyltransferase [Campylobacter hyointestinalis subsp. hyointestinalis]MDY2998755.1 protein-L-isoaspartate(D-aspartate) O-methyltransferase [Campylobacter hyointestinalis]PPB53551.1 protein-L-isoaspartate O-methyltransferase [Campylobacter hyointestinalis subsp. hyointestinalis]PPB54419.1 protein-L-isoaspartate O-methyltransferase [Campylobacter hyointest